MRALKRREISTTTLRKLAELHSRVQSDSSPRERAAALWKNKPRAEFAEVRATLIEMAPGRTRCMYCEDSMGTDIDHFWPKADYPHGTFCWHNYLLACSHCNSNLKREQFPRDENGSPLLVDPTAEDPAEHLLFSPSTGKFLAVGSKGDDTIRVFGLNDDAPPRRLSTGRRQALVALYALLERFDRQMLLDDPEATATRTTLLEHPFSSVLVWLLATTSQPGVKHVIDSKILEIIERHQVRAWL